jgi:hypothetical protein
VFQIGCSQRKRLGVSAWHLEYVKLELKPNIVGLLMNSTKDEQRSVKPGTKVK